MNGPVRVVTWNLSNRIESVQGVGLALESMRADIVLLQGATKPLFDKLRPILSRLELRSTTSSIDEARSAGKHAANVIASRWATERVLETWGGRSASHRSWVSRYNRLAREHAPWMGSAPQPWLLLRAVIQSPWGRIDTISARVPTVVRNKWDKVKTMSAVAAALEEAPPELRILGGDLATTATGSGHGGGRDGSSNLWREAERALLGPGARHSLVDAFRLRHPATDAPDAASRLVAGRALRRFDHILASPQFVPDSADYQQQWMDSPEARGLSDHAPLLVSFLIRLLPVTRT